MDFTFMLIASGVSFVLFLVGFHVFSRLWERMKEEEYALDRLNSFSPDRMQTTEDINLFQRRSKKIIEKKLQKYLANMKSENWFQLKLYKIGLNYSITSFFFCWAN
jgi:hypothetical protein